jgi:hypothetical protein
MNEIPWEQLNKATIVISLIEGAILFIQVTIWLLKNKSTITSLMWRLFVKTIILIISSLPALVFLFLFTLVDLSLFWILSLRIIFIFVVPGAIPALLMTNYGKSLLLSILFSMLAGIFVSIFFWSYAIYANNIIRTLLSLSYVSFFIVSGFAHSIIVRKLRVAFADHAKMKT